MLMGQLDFEKSCLWMLDMNIKWYVECVGNHARSDIMIR